MKRKSLLFLMLMTMLAPLAMNGQQTAVLNDGTTTTSYVPFYGLYADYGAKGQFIIPATDLANKGITSGSQISKLKFFSSATSTGTFFGTSVKVEVGEVSYTSFSSNAFVTSGLTTVLSGTSLSRSSDGTMVVSFSSNYTYTGGNLLISIGGYGSGCPSTSWYGVSSTNAGVYGYNSSNSQTIPSSASGRTSYAPKTEITYLPGNTPYISLTPSSATVITGSTETLTATYGNVSGTPTITYSSNNTSVATVSGSGTTATVTAVAPGTATITATMNGSYTATCAITVEDPSYCTPTPSSVDGKGITAVTFGTDDVVNNSNSNGLPASSPYYGDYTSMVGSSEAGETVTVAITYSTGSSTVYSYGTLIWVDWNKNYTFEDSEIVYTGTSAQGSNGTPQVLTATFTVPATQAADDYRMRIAGADSYFDSYIGGSTSANHSPCFSSTYAVCHDYTLRVNSASNCPAPTDLAVNNITPNSATVSWSGEAESYNVRYKELSTETLYDFEAGMPYGWTTIDADGDGFNWVLGSASDGVYTYGGNLSGYGYNSSNDLIVSGSYRNISDESGTALTPDNFLVSQEIVLGGTISFYAHGSNSSYVSEHFGVFVSISSNNNPNDFVLVNEWTATTTSYIQYSASLSAYAGQRGYVAIRHFNCTDQFLLSIDNITITEPGGDWIIDENVISPYTITGLNIETNYEVQVQADCGTEGESNWSASATFTTPDGCAVPTGLTAEVTGNAAELSWTGAQENYNVHYREVDPTVPATIILNVPTDIWNDGSGYQLVLDADHNTYGTTIPTSGNFTAGTFADFEYTIPENAECSTTTNTIVVNGNASITIPAGVYDYVFLNPDPNGTTYYIASSNGFSARGDDYEFEAGQTYEFTLSIVGSNDYITATITDNNTWTLVEGVNNPYTLENLSAQTTYKYQVQGVDCDGNGNNTDWSASATFTTGEFYVKHIKGYGTGTGNWYLIASPIGTIANNNLEEKVINIFSNSYDLFYFDQAKENEWVNYKPNESGTSTNPHFGLEKGKGYLYANSNDVDLVFTGQAHNTEDMEIELNLTETASGYTIDLPGWNLVGNPYAELAYIDIVSEERPFYTMNGGGTAFEAVTGGSIEPMEGIFVVAEEDGETMTFTTTEPTSKGKGLALNLSDSHNRIDRAIVRFNKGRTLPKLMLFENSSKIYIPVDGKDYAVVRSEEVGEMPVNFKAENNGSYTLSLSVDNVEFGYLHLIDNKTGMDIDLLQTPSYTFEAKTTDYESRFKLVFATGNNSNDDDFAFFSNGSFVINNEGNAELQVIDLMGRIVKSESINGCANVSVNGAAGVYMLRLINGDNVKVQKVVVK